MRLIFALFLSLIFSFPAVAFAPLGNPITSQQTATAAGSLILKTSAGFLNEFTLTSSSTTAGYVLIFDSATVPADGTVTPKFCYYTAAPGTVSQSFGAYSVPFANGITVVFSTTGCYTKTISNTAIFISGQIQ